MRLQSSSCGRGLRAHAVQFSKRKAKEKKDKENILQDEFNNAKKTFECDSTNKNASDFNSAKEKLEHFYEEKPKVSSFVHGCDGVNTVKRVRNIF